LLNGIATVGRIQFDREHPILEKIFPLTDYRIQGLIAPVVSQPVFAIRTRPKKIYRLSDLAESGNTDQRRVDYVFSSITHRTPSETCSFGIASVPIRTSLLTAR
jgi:Flp pilus assembly CpaF family ATPase